MTFLSLFSGIGGIDLGLERAGMTCIGQVEIELFPRAVLAKHWPDVFRWSDVCDLPAELVRYAVGRPDLIAGGFACQDVSAAGKGAGIGRQTRSGLTWRNLFRLARGLRPDWLLIENVPVLRTRGADRVIRALERIGYTCWPVVVGAWAVGAPHKRDRVWIVGHANGVRRERMSEVGREVRPSNDGPQEPQSARWTAEEFAGNGPEVFEFDWIDGIGPLADAANGRRQPGTGLRIDGEPRGGREPAGPNQGLADSPSRGLGTNRGAQRDAGHADECGTNKLDNAEQPRLEGHGADQGPGGRDAEAGPVAAAGVCSRWPARPSEPQHDWEAPRLVEFPLGGFIDGVSARLVRAANKHALKAYGNSVVPAVVEEIGRIIVELNDAA